MEDAQPVHEPETSQPPVPNPVMDVVAPPPKQADETAPPPALAAAHPKSQLPHLEPAPKKPSSRTKPPAAKGVTTAIVATVIIVLGLAALAVYAYLKQK